MSFTYTVFCFSGKRVRLISSLATLCHCREPQVRLWPLGRIGSSTHANHDNNNSKIWCVLSNKVTWSVWASRKKLLDF